MAHLQSPGENMHNRSLSLELVDQDVIYKEVRESCDDAVRAIQVLQKVDTQKFIVDVATLIATRFSEGNKIIIAGNGGSLCDAMHVAEEFTGYFRSRRPALPAIALSDPGHITCVGNDTSFDDIFSRGVEAFGMSGDVFIALTTSGKSENLRRAVMTAKEKGLWTVAFLGKSGGAIKGICHHELIVSDFLYSDRIQEVHMSALHIIIQAIEALLFPPPKKL